MEKIETVYREENCEKKPPSEIQEKLYCICLTRTWCYKKEHPEIIKEHLKLKYNLIILKMKEKDKIVKNVNDVEQFDKIENGLN